LKKKPRRLALGLDSSRLFVRLKRVLVLVAMNPQLPLRRWSRLGGNTVDECEAWPRGCRAHFARRAINVSHTVGGGRGSVMRRRGRPRAFGFITLKT